MLHLVQNQIRLRLFRIDRENSGLTVVFTAILYRSGVKSFGESAFQSWYCGLSR